MTGQHRQRPPGVEGMKFVARLRAVPKGGSITIEGNELIIDSADEVLLLRFRRHQLHRLRRAQHRRSARATEDDITKAIQKPYDQLKAAHRRPPQLLRPHEPQPRRWKSGVRPAATATTDERSRRWLPAAPIPRSPPSISTSAAT
jgi:hypothetical protein